MNKAVILGIALLTTTSGCTQDAAGEGEATSPFATLFTGAEQYENFNRMADLVPTSRLTPSTQPFRFPEGDAVDLPDAFSFRGNRVDTAQFLEETDTSALLVLKDGAIRHESYFLTGGRNVNWLSMSVAKSFTSALVGIAVSEGHIRSVSDPITDYVRSLKGSAYEGVSIEDVLQMSSGTRWSEDYGDPDSDVARLGAALQPGGSLTAFLGTMVREVEPGTRNLYNSADTQALGELLTRATGQSVTDYMQEKLWQPLGMEAPAYWINDSHGMEMTFAGLNATARDYAKLGELYRNRGRWGDVQLIPESWVDASTVADADHLKREVSDFGMGYGYQWWLMDNSGNEYSAIGIYNQFIYVNPGQDLVIVKLSAFSDYALTDEESSFRELETIDLFRAIGNQLENE